MNPQTFWRIVPSLLAVAIVLVACSSSSPPPPAVGSARISYNKGAPGGVLLQTVKITATVVAIDLAKRQATLQGEDGKPFTVKLGADAVHSDQLHAGDPIAATVTQKVLIVLDQEESPSPGASPTVEGIRMTARVIAIDSTKRVVTFRFEGGDTESLPVRNDVELSRHKVGDQFSFHVTEMTAIWIERAH